MNPTQSQLDPKLVTLAKAIRQTESNGDFTAKGKSGEYGAYQFMPSTWSSTAPKYGVNVPLERSTPEQQNEVAYKQMEEWSKQHPDWNIGNYASAWNAGAGRPNAYLENNKGVNDQGVSYDTGLYAQRVAEAYHKIKGQDQQQSAPQGNGFVNPAQTQQQQPQTGNGFVPTTPLEAIASGQAGDTSQQPQQNSGGLMGSLLKGAGGLYNSVASPFVGLAAAPVQGLAKVLGQPDPYAKGIPSIGGANTPVTDLNVEKKLGDAAQVGSYFVPGSGVLGAAGMGALQGAGSAMSAGKDASEVAVSGALGAGLGAGAAGTTKLVGSGIGKAGGLLSGEASQKAVQGIKDAYSSALNLNASQRAFESRSGKDIADVLLQNKAPLGKYADGTLDASGAIDKLNEVLNPLSEKANALISRPHLNQNAANFIPLDAVQNSVAQAIKKSTVDSVSKEALIHNLGKLFDATKREYGDMVSPQIAEDIKQGLQSTAFKKSLTTSDALQGNVNYLASKEFKKLIEQAVSGTSEGKEYAAINAQRSDLLDAIKRLTKLDGVQKIKGGQLGNMVGGLVGAISGAATGLGPLGAIGGDYFGNKAAAYLQDPATKIGAAELKAKASGLLPSLLGEGGKVLGKKLSGLGGAVSKSGRGVGLLTNLLTAPK